MFAYVFIAFPNSTLIVVVQSQLKSLMKVKVNLVVSTSSKLKEVSFQEVHHHQPVPIHCWTKASEHYRTPSAASCIQSLSAPGSAPGPRAPYTRLAETRLTHNWLYTKRPFYINLIIRREFILHQLDYRCDWWEFELPSN